jgi:hypothetical protein
MLRIFNKKKILFKALVVGTIGAFMGSFSLPYIAFAYGQVRVPAGTVVNVATNAVITPETVKMGDTVDLSVTSDVVVDGKVVIKAGAKASGEVIQSKNRNYVGIPAKIGIAVRSVQAVDGTTIILSGSKLVEGKDKMVTSIGLSLICCILFAAMKGGDASIPAGTSIQATVAVTTPVTTQ